SAGGNADAFVTKLNANGTLGYSTYLGGSGGDSGQAVAVDPGGTAFVTGGTTSGDFPTLSPFQRTFGGTQDAFVARLTAAGSLAYSTYLGGSSADAGAGIGLDIADNAYVTGSTSSTNFPVQMTP